MPLHTSCNFAKIRGNQFGGLALLKLCLVLFLTVDVSMAQNHSESDMNIGNSNRRKDLTKNLTEKAESELIPFPHILPFRMDSFLKSLKDLDTQQNQNIRKKKSVKRSDKKIQATEMRDRIKDLMLNISRTLNDVDWYFAYEQLDAEKNKEKEYFVSEPTQKLVIKRMKEVDDDTADVFIDSFVKQMYELDPLILQKIDDRIDSEFSSDSELSRDSDLSNIKRAVRLAPTARTRKARVSTVLVNEDYSYVDEMLTKVPNYLNGINKVFQHKNIAKLLSYEEEATTTTEPTTFENFYDYGDYYKESEDKLRDVAHYEIVQDVLHSTSGVNMDHDGNSYKVQIKSKNKKTRNFHKNKEILKKKLKNKLETFESKNYKDYNIDSDY